jgi:DNA-binding CsgD family transcriptional regulator
VEGRELEQWLADVAQTIDENTFAATPIIAVDVTTGRVLGQTDAAVALLGCEVPDRIEDLLALGIMARPDVDALRRRVAGVSALPALPGLVGNEAAHSWSTQVRVHPPGGASRPVELHVAHHRRPGLGAEVLWVTLIPVTAHEDAAPAPTEVTGGLRFTSILDRQARIVATGPEARALWKDLESLSGKVATAMTHPEDLPVVLPAANAVFTGMVDRASYTARLAVDGGRWVALRVDVERVISGNDHLLVMRNEVIDETRRTVPVGVLSAREFAVVVALFDGLRINQVAARDGVAPKTVRNQLVSAYRKLGVSGQEELLRTYHRPNRR